MIDDKYPRYIRADEKNRKQYLLPLIEDKQSEFYKRDQTELFFLAAAIGYKNKNRIPLKGNKIDLRLYIQLSDDKKMFMRALALGESNLDYTILEDGRKVFQILEEYANGGIKLLYDSVLSGNLEHKFEHDIWDQLKKEK